MAPNQTLKQGNTNILSQTPAHTHTHIFLILRGFLENQHIPDVPWDIHSQDNCEGSDESEDKHTYKSILDTHTRTNTLV